MKKFLCAVSFVLLVSTAAFPASGQFAISGGYLKYTGSNSDLWSGGFYVSGHGLIQVTQGFYVGLEGAYYRWGLDDNYFQDFIDHYSLYGIEATISGSASNIQIFPCIRYEFVHARSFRPFIHLGGGLSIMNAKAEASVSFLGYSDSIKVDESGTRIGGNIGIGVRILTSNTIGVEALALFNLYSGEGGGTANWFTVGIGLSFRR